MKIKRIGFIGLGAMGYPMAKHLLNAGYKLNIAHHSGKAESVERVEDLVRSGADLVNHINEIPQDADLIISILPTGEEVKSVLYNNDFRAKVSPTSPILDMTSCEAQVLIDLEDFYKERGITILDGPVSGGVKGAQAGSLTVFGSGDKKKFEEIREVISSFSKNIYYIGKLGSGKILKSINQMMIAINAFGVIEGFNLASEQGIDFDIMKDIISQSSGSSYAFINYFDRLVKDEFQPGFKLSLMKKDLKVALDSSQGGPLPVSNLVYNLLLMGETYKDLDFSSISKIYNIGK